jgi:hypothetical protein
MNKYRHQFVSKCPNNGHSIIYVLTIETDNEMIHAEHITRYCALLPEGYHEAIADNLKKAFPGLQTMVATHDGVEITTVRGGR